MKESDTDDKNTDLEPGVLNATIILDLLSSFPDDFMAEGCKDPPPETTQAEHFFADTH
jgi:hypothetical protein